MLIWTKRGGKRQLQGNGLKRLPRKRSRQTSERTAGVDRMHQRRHARSKLSLAPTRGNVWHAHVNRIERDS